VDTGYSIVFAPDIFDLFLLYFCGLVLSFWLFRPGLWLLQDVATKVMQFAQHGPRAMCVLSANGAISNATLRQQQSSGGTVTYEVLLSTLFSTTEISA